MVNAVYGHLSIFCLYSSCFHLKHRTSVKRFVSLQFINFRQSIGPLGREISSSQRRYLHRTIQTQNKCTQTFIPRVGFEPTIPAFEGAKRFHDLRSRATTVVAWLRNANVRNYTMYYMIRIGLIWLRIGNRGGLLWTRCWTFGFHKMLESSREAAQLAASQEGLSSVSK
jgi:hypothetical protein